MELQYLFRAYFADGTVYAQTPDDTALHAPSGSAFSDVLYLQRQGKELVAFALCRGGEPVAAVHLADGRFELGGNEFWVGGPAPEKPTLVYHRAVTRERSLDVDAVTLVELGEWRETVQVRYVIGWEAGGVQHTIALE